MIIETPIGKVEMPDSYADEYKDKTDVELMETFIKQYKGFIDPVLFQILKNKNLIKKTDKEFDLQITLDKLKLKERTEKLHKELGTQIYNITLPEPIEWYYLIWDALREDWKSGVVVSNSYKFVEKYLEHKIPHGSERYIVPHTEAGTEACFRSAWD